ncbi:uncharacterized protein VP01_13728g2, partial [Puccinia sorghi]
MKVFKEEKLDFNKFLDDFKSIFFDHNCQSPAEVALQSLCQTGKVLAYTQEFNSHACHIGWADAPLMTMLMSNIQFTSLQTMQ